MKYPKEYIDEIKNRLKVSTVVSKSVSLKTKINNASINSKEIKKNDIFFAIKGKKNDGNLFVKEAYVGKSLVMKRFRPRAKGRASPIKKPFSRITIVLEEKKEKKDKK